MEVLALILKMPASDYIFCLLWDAAFGLVPALLVLTGNVTVIMPSVICISISIAVIF